MSSEEQAAALPAAAWSASSPRHGLRLNPRPACPGFDERFPCACWWGCACKATPCRARWWRRDPRLQGLPRRGVSPPGCAESWRGVTPGVAAPGGPMSGLKEENSGARASRTQHQESGLSAHEKTGRDIRFLAAENAHDPVRNHHAHSGPLDVGPGAQGTPSSSPERPEKLA